MNIDPKAVTDIIRDVVDTEVLPRFRNLTKDEIRSKTGPTDLVTEADIQAEIALTARLLDLLPGSKVVGEEAVHDDPSILDRLQDDGPVWIIDPVDGTNNFSRGNPLFGCIVALAIGGETVMGWIDHCLERETTVAVKGAGVERAGAPVSLVPRLAKPLGDMEGYLGGKALMNLFHHRAARVGRVGSAAHVYLSLSQGNGDFAIFTRMKPWDHAAGILIHREAGGIVRLLSDEDYAPTMNHGVPVIAANEEEWNTVSFIARAGGVSPA
ncbi:MAG: inositol phosphatase [Rhodospirillum sp.]|nr:inositol phosphatase [Rhodospirillum sp.]MCF8487726.1 inositol phosphatase [Rhodospirillum sp.]MCF8500396.1 inositol phosphatase [Rhodospirillum sp.]